MTARRDAAEIQDQGTRLDRIGGDLGTAWRAGPLLGDGAPYQSVGA
jgi:hypothetical protein